MRRAVFSWLFLVLCRVASGDDARFLLPAALAARVETGQHCGLWVAMETRENGVAVTVSRAIQALPDSPAYPIKSTERCGDPGALEVPPSFTVPGGLVGIKRQTLPALVVLTRVVEFVSQRIALDENDEGPQDAAEVLCRSRARCSGRANLAVGLLRALGVPSRVVRGLVIGTKGARWHRWGEAWLGPLLGWTAFDPGAAVGLVSVRYLPLRGSGEGLSLAGLVPERLNERGYLGLPLRHGLRFLGAGGVRVHCLAPAGVKEFTALLVGPDGSRWARHGRGEVVFAGMLPGEYRVVWSGGGRWSAFDLDLGGSPDVRVELDLREVARS